MAGKKRNIVRLRRRFQPNVGAIIFLIVFLYMAFYLIQYISKDKIQVYEVTAGTESNTSQYTGLILREESVSTLSSAGYVNYYCREDDRVSVGEYVYTLDETGHVSDMLQEMSEAEDLLTDDSLMKLKNQLSDFSASYSGFSFDEVYQTKSSLNSSLLEYINSSLLQNSDGGESTAFAKIKAEESGIVEFYTDGYEDVSAEQVTAELLDQSSYKEKRKNLQSTELLEKGTAVYKTITSDEWDIIVPVSDTDKQRLADRNLVTVHFIGTSLECNAECEFIVGAKGEGYLKLHLYRYMVRFASERFVKIELIYDQVEGLKIPVSSVISKAFYKIPAAYVTQGGDSSSDEGFLVASYSSGVMSTEFISATLFYMTGDTQYCYVDCDDFESGTEIVMPDTNETFTIGDTASLQGVYNINKGYAVFRQIKILAILDDFYIIEKGTNHGLSAYDNIVLNASTVEENAFLN